MNAVEMRMVDKKYGKQQVLKGITEAFAGGRIHGIIGRNGSGKTVLLKVICGLTKIDAGEILLWDKKTRSGCEIAQNIGAIINTPAFVDTVSGLKNLTMLASIRRKIDKKQACEAMLTVGLDPNSRKWVCKYSMGMKQRLGIAQAIMEDPDLLILDEPMNGLDNQGADDMRKLFLNLKAQGKTILLASHNREDIDILCDHVYEMDAGRLSQTR